MGPREPRRVESQAPGLGISYFAARGPQDTSALHLQPSRSSPVRT